MKNLLNIEDQVKINMPGSMSDGVIGVVESMQKWADGSVHYIAKYHQKCPNGGDGYDTTIQFTEGQYSIISSSDNKNENATKELSIEVKLDGLEDIQNQLEQMDRVIEDVRKKINEHMNKIMHGQY